MGCFPSKEDDNLFIQYENDVDEVTIPLIEDNYPAPVPLNASVKNVGKIKWFENCDKRTGQDGIRNAAQKKAIFLGELESNAAKTPKTALGGFKELIDHLHKPVKSIQHRDEIMVWAILVWLSIQKTGQFKSEKGSRTTPLGFLSLLGQKRTTYTTLFTVLCRQAGIKCAIIHGVCKAGSYQPGDENIEDFRSTWNAVYVNQTWQIVHSFWVCRSVTGRTSGGWIKLEESGKSVRKREKESRGVEMNDFQEDYIMPDPGRFIYNCHPNEQQWQLLSSPITRKMFVEQAYLWTSFWDMDLKLISENKCALQAPGGTATITMHTPKATANQINLDYKFYYKEGSGSQQAENDMLKPQTMPRLVAKIRNATEWNFDIQLPVEGDYRIVIKGSQEGQYLSRLCEFKIQCSKGKEDCRLMPFDPGLIGFGPGPEAEKAGLLLPSHRNGLITTDKKASTALSFLLDSDMAESIQVKTKLIDSNATDCSHLVESTIVSKELKIVTRIEEDGDYGLRILSGYSEHGRSRNVTLKIVCNYLISTSTKFVREKANQRIARRNLLASIEVGKIEEIESSINKCLKEKISEVDSDIENAQRKVDVLRLRKEVHDTYMRRHLETTRITIHHIEQSMYKRIFLESIRHLERQVAELNSLRGFTQEVPTVLNALAELNKIHSSNEMVINVLKALLILYGDEPKSIQSLDEVQTVAKELTHKVRTKDQHTLKASDARQAQVCITKFTYDQTRKTNMAAAAVYKWVDEVTTTVAQN